MRPPTLRLGLCLAVVLACFVYAMSAPAMRGSPSSTDGPVAPPSSVLEAARRTMGLSTFVYLVKAAKLEALLEDPAQHLTVLAPSDGAFNKLGREALVALFNDPDASARLVKAHLLPTRLSIAALAKAGSSETLLEGGGRLTFATVMEGLPFLSVRSEDDPSVSASLLPAPDGDAANGILHVLDTALVSNSDAPKFGAALSDPLPTVSQVVGSHPQLTSLSAMLSAHRINSLQEFIQASNVPAPFTFFAPSNAAIKALTGGEIGRIMSDKSTLEEMLRQHIVPSRAVLLDKELQGTSPLSLDNLGKKQLQTWRGGLHNQAFWAKGHDGRKQANVSPYDLAASDGVVQVVDNLLVHVIPGGPFEAAAPLTSGDKTVSELVAAREDLSVLRGLMARHGIASLQQFLDSQRPADQPAGQPVTFFAPTDAALRALPSEQMGRLEGDKAAVLELLRHHTVAGRAVSLDKQIVGGNPLLNLATLAGKKVQAWRYGWRRDTFWAKGHNIDGTMAARVRPYDLAATDGFLQVIDKLLVKLEFTPKAKNDLTAAGDVFMQ